jgi:hypothetical protein
MIVDGCVFPIFDIVCILATWTVKIRAVPIDANGPSESRELSLSSRSDLCRY